MLRPIVRTAAALLVSLALALAPACGSDPATEAPEQPSEGAAPATPGETSGTKLTVVTTSNILADWVRAVGGDRVEVFPLLPANADPHTFQPGPQDITRVADADVVFSVGLSLEAGWLEELIANAAGDPEAIVPLGDGVDPIDFVEILEEHGEGEEEEEGHGEEGHAAEEEDDGHGEEGHAAEEGDHGHGELDPHFWFDPIRVQQAVDSIAARLAAVDPAGQSFYHDNAAAYNGQLDSLHAWIQEQVATLRAERRVLVTSHDSFQYFAVRYGFEVAGAIFPVTTQAEPTAQELSALIETIEHEGVPAVFTEKSHSERLARRVSEETGATLIGGLYTGSLGEVGGEAGTYVDLMRHNTTTIVEALR